MNTQEIIDTILKHLVRMNKELKMQVIREVLAQVAKDKPSDIERYVERVLK